MGYIIQYGQTVVKKSCHQDKKKKIKKRIATACIIIFVFAILICIRESFYPGDRDVTKQALENMADSIQSGQGFGQAFRVFCEEIIAGADIS